MKSFPLSLDLWSVSQEPWVLSLEVQGSLPPGIPLAMILLKWPL